MGEEAARLKRVKAPCDKCDDKGYITRKVSDGSCTYLCPACTPPHSSEK